MSQMANRQTLVVLLLLMLMTAAAAWLQFGVLGGAGRGGAVGVAVGVESAAADQPDYYIRNFTSTGVQPSGLKYQLSAEGLVHYPLDERTLLERPRIIQYRPDGARRHIHADSGQLYDDRAEVLLSGNVRVVESPAGDGAGATATSETLLIRLKDGG